MAKTFEHYMIVRQEHLNQYGNLFGGAVLAVIDELAFIACARTFPGKNFVTRAVDNAQFTAPARLGDILEFRFGIERVGRTSISVRVCVVVYAGRTGNESTTFDGHVTMVCVDEQGSPVPVKDAAD